MFSQILFAISVFAFEAESGNAVPSSSSACLVSDWGPWSACLSTSTCTSDVPATWPMTDDMKSEGKGRHAMKKMMEIKTNIHNHRVQCQQDNTCPQLNVPPSTGMISCVDGYAGEYPCHNINLVSFINFDDLGYGTDISGNETREGNDLWVWHDEINQEDYVIMGTTGGSSFVRITNPDKPEVLGFLPTQTFISTWRDMKVVNDHVFIGSEAPDHGVQVFDLTQLRGLAADSSRRFTADFHYQGVGQSHNIVANPENNRIFIVGSTVTGNGNYTTCNGGLHIVDVNEPQNPTFLGCFADDGYTHDAQCLIYANGPDTRYEGHEICFCYNEDSFTIVDTTDASAPVMVSRVYYEGAQYSHQGWASEDLRFNFLDDELDEYYQTVSSTKTFIWDTTDLTNPVIVNSYMSIEKSIDHNMYIKGNYIYQSNYEAGLRVLLINDFAANNASLSEVAYFDVLPSSTRPEFFGTWSNYPWLKDNIVAVSSIDYGLYLLRVDFAAIEAEQAASYEYGKMERYREALYGGPLAECPPLVEKIECPPTDHGC